MVRYLDFKLIAQKWQWWRLVTNFLFFGDNISIDFLFHMYFLVRYVTSLFLQCIIVTFGYPSFSVLL